MANPQKARSVVTKIALQINCKLGGDLWALKIPVRFCCYGNSVVKWEIREHHWGLVNQGWGWGVA